MSSVVVESRRNAVSAQLLAPTSRRRRHGVCLAADDGSGYTLLHSSDITTMGVLKVVPDDA